jgi:hypothetical protein
MEITLPIDIYYQIFLMIRYIERPELRLVCHDWKNMLDNKSMWNDVIYISDNDLSHLRIESFKWVFNNTRMLETPLSICTALTKICNVSVCEWIFNESIFSKMITSDIKFMLDLFGKYEDRSDASLLIFNIILLKSPKYKQLCCKIMLDKFYDHDTRKIVDIIQTYNFDITIFYRSELTLRLVRNGFYNEAKEFMKGYPTTKQTEKMVKKAVTLYYLEYKDMTKLRKLIKIFELMNPENNGMIPCKFVGKYYNSINFMRLIHVLPNGNNNHLWESDVYRKRSANFIYTAITKYKSKKNSWSDMFDWSMNLFPSVMKHADVNEICNKYKHHVKYCCPISKTFSKSSSGYFIKLVKTLRLSGKTVEKHLRCSYDNILQDSK